MANKIGRLILRLIPIISVILIHFNGWNQQSQLFVVEASSPSSSESEVLFMNDRAPDFQVRSDSDEFEESQNSSRNICPLRLTLNQVSYSFMKYFI